jgi:PadR family transcriptional regulator PadR
MPGPKKKKPRQHPGKQERYLQASLLLGLLHKASYGYELIQNIQRYGFIEGDPPPGMVYRHLRQLEEDGLVSSRWETGGTGPAKRMYNITDDGGEVLEIWIGYMKRQSKKLNDFIKMYQELEREDL